VNFQDGAGRKTTAKHKPARGYGGTADVVAEARQRGVPLTIIWPEGASRDQAA